MHYSNSNQHGCEDEIERDHTCGQCLKVGAYKKATKKIKYTPRAAIRRRRTMVGSILKSIIILLITTIKKESTISVKNPLFYVNNKIHFNYNPYF